MQIVIDIPEELKEVFDKAKEDDLKGSYYDYNSIIGKAIQNGIPLPKEYGRLIDADAYLANTPIRKSADDTWIKETYVYESIMEAPTIIEADKDGE